MRNFLPKSAPAEDPRVDMEGNSLADQERADKTDSWEIWTAEEREIFSRGSTDCPFPFGQYFTKRLDAQPEYQSRIRPLLLSFCKATFTSFSLGLLAYGVTYTSTHNAIIVIANNVDTTHRQSIYDLVQSLKDLNHAYVINCYVGETTVCSMDDGHLREHSQHPEIGQSLGVANCSSSFSLGAYLRLEGDDNDYALSVYHGLPLPVHNIEANSTPIVIEQPSQSDYEAAIKSVEGTIDLYDGEVWTKIPFIEQRRKQAKEQLRNIRSVQRNFGQVVAGEMAVVDTEIGVSWADWILIKVDPPRVRRYPNILDFQPKDIMNQALFVPRDHRYYYITSEGKVELGVQIVKAGRATGITTGKIEFVKFDVKLPDSSAVTSEYTVVSPPTHVFSVRGDSGAGVLGPNGAFLGTILGGCEGFTLRPGCEDQGFIKLSYITPWTLLSKRIRKALKREVYVKSIPAELISEDGVLDIES